MIREANIKDVEAIALINSTVWKESYRGIIEAEYLEQITIEHRIQKISQVIREDTFFVYEKNNIIEGFISGKTLNNNKCEIIALYVGLEFQGKNIGTQLLNYAKDFFKNKGCGKMIIWTIKNLKNNSFYQKNSGRIIEEKMLEIGNKNYPGICFLIEL